MRTGTVDSSRQPSIRIAAAVLINIVVLVWRFLRLPLLALLLIAEPVVRVTLWGAAFLGVLTAFLFESSGAVSNFPFWLIMSISTGCILMLPVYYTLLRLLS